MSIKRSILNPSRSKNGLIEQPKEVGPDREVVEAHNRERFANHFKYADPYTGNTRTFDESGNYNCGACNQADGDRCLLLKIKKIDRKAGSCGDWENLCAGDPEMVLHEKSPEVASYGVATNGVGFGCHRCPYASKAIKPDSKGRSLFCGKGDFRVFPKACCALNGAAVKDEKYSKSNAYDADLLNLLVKVPEDHRELVVAELESRIEKARANNDDSTAFAIEKSMRLAKSLWKING